METDGTKRIIQSAIIHQIFGGTLKITFQRIFRDILQTFWIALKHHQTGWH